MTRNSRTCPALTLIEVLVALFILATGFLAALLAQKEYLSQFGDLHDQGAAVEYARGLLAQMQAQRDFALPSNRGSVPDHPEWWWTQTAQAYPADGNQRIYLLRAGVYQKSGKGEDICMARLETLMLLPGASAKGPAP